jgi:hypothetical protein
MGCGASKPKPGPKPIEEEDWLPLPAPRFPPRDSPHARQDYETQQKVGLYGSEFNEIKRHLRKQGKWAGMVRDGKFADIKREWEKVKRAQHEAALGREAEQRVVRAEAKIMALEAGRKSATRPAGAAQTAPAAKKTTPARQTATSKPGSRLERR